MKRTLYICILFGAGTAWGLFVFNRGNKPDPKLQQAEAEAVPRAGTVNTKSSNVVARYPSSQQVKPSPQIQKAGPVFDGDLPKVNVNRFSPNIDRTQGLLAVDQGVAVTTALRVKSMYDIRSALLIWDIHSGGLRCEVELPAETRCLARVRGAKWILVSGGPTNKANNKPFIYKVDLTTGKVIAKGDNPLKYNHNKNLLINKSGSRAYLCREGKQGYRARGSSKILDELPERITTTYDSVTYNVVVEYDLLSPVLRNRRVDPSVWARLKSENASAYVPRPSWINTCGATDGKFALADDGSGVAVWRMDTWEKISRLGDSPDPYKKFIPSLDGSLLLVMRSAGLYQERALAVWDMESFRVVVLTDDELILGIPFFSKDGCWVRYVRKQGAKAELVSLNWRDGREHVVYRFPERLKYEWDEPEMCSSVNGQILVIGGAGKEAKIIRWDDNGGAKIKQLNMKLRLPFAISSDGRYLWYQPKSKCEGGAGRKGFDEDENTMLYYADLIDLSNGQIMQTVSATTVGHRPNYNASFFEGNDSLVCYRVGGGSMGHYGAGLFHVPLSGPIKDLSKQIKVEQAFRVGISQLPGTNQNWGVFAPFDGRMIVFDPKSGKSQFEYSWNHDNPAWVAQASSSGRFFIPLTGGGIRVIDVEGTPLKATLIGEIWGLPDGGWFAINPEGRYAASLGAEEHVRLSYKGKTYRFEQFDLFLNRPDLVAKSFGSNHDLVSLLEDVYQRRLKRLGRNISPDAINKAPIIHITSEKKLTSEALTYMIDFEALSQGDDLSEILIYNNGIPVLGERGKPVLSNQTRTLKDKISVSLATGTNQIQIIARSLNGYESLPESVIIHRKARSSHADLFLLAVGVSDYQDDQYDLQYPSKDAGDMIKQFEKSVKDFGQVHVRKLINHEVTKESIKESRKFLAQSRPGDHVVIFIAGHGLLAQKGAAKGEYYYCPHDIDFSNPAVRGLSYQDLIGVVDGIPAQKRLILLDTCHAGELTLGDSRKLLANNKMARGVRAIAPLAVSETDQGGDPLSKRRIEEIFSDLRRGAGATVITASGGMEYAYESDDWKNGVFTYSVLSALRGKQADSNQDQVIQASELINYVAKHVQQLTDGNQRPTVRAKNLFVDFPVIRETRVSIDPETTIQAYLSRSGGYTYESAASMFAPRSKYFGKTVTPSEIRRDVEEYRKKYYAVDYKLKEVVNKKWSSDKLTVTVQYRISYNATYSAKPDRHGSRMATTRRGEMLCEINLQWDGIDWKIHGIKVISSKKLK